MQTYAEVEAKGYADTRREAEKWWIAQMHEDGEFYLYVKPSCGKTPGEILIAREQPEGYILASPERISPVWSKDRAMAFIRGVYRTLPVCETE